MGNYEDAIYLIFEELENKNLKNEFYKQLEKMKFQEKHRYKSPKDKYEYAFDKVIKNDSLNYSTSSVLSS